ncbi:nitroreductase/quinone reductase family protein [Nocardia anaemiae]|uniref:nitroreductase/quinone reductase family protein n=1 Tax=Nocardia anaemiae TaxID=263910 RepID=UPI0007A4BCF4|nr:nitroreductase/quinone reductase family protein [Nocardia anaemiae]
MTSSKTRTTQSRIQRTGDAVVRFILRSPLHPLLSKKLLIITVSGRKTGREYANPVGYAEHEGHLLIGTAATWRHNLIPNTPVRILLRGSHIQATHEVITDETRAATLYREILAQNPAHGRFAKIHLDPDGTVNLPSLRTALSRGTAIVRLHPL